MTASPRRPRGSVLKKTNLFAKVEPPLKAKVDRVAAALGVNQAQAVELILENLELDANGRPSWWDGPLAHDTFEELPLQNVS